jgi:hypothetical protein
MSVNSNAAIALNIPSGWQAFWRFQQPPATRLSPGTSQRNRFTLQVC